MSWLAPLSLAQLGALLALAFGWLAWLHLRRPRPRRRRVPFLGAWDEVAPPGTASPASWAFVRTGALLRAALVVMLVGVALSDPKPEWLVAPARTAVFVLDAGAHMAATDEKPSRFERARALALKLLSERSAGDRLMVTQLDSTLTALSGWGRPGSDLVQLRAAVRAARPSYEATNFGALRAFAREQLRGKPGAEVSLFSDGAFQVAPSELAELRDAGVVVRQLEVGSSTENLAIRTFAVRAYPWDAERSEALVELENAGSRSRAVELTLFEQGRPVDVRPFRLEAQSRERELVELGATGTQFTARISAIDGAVEAQTLDDEAYAVLATSRPRRVLLVTTGQRYLESALALDRRLAVEKLAPHAFRSARGYDLAIFDGFVPSEPPGVPALWLAPGGLSERGRPAGGTARAKNAGHAVPVAARAAPYRVVGVLERPFFDEVQTDNSALRAISVRDVNIRRAQRVQLEPKDEVLARSSLGALIVKGERAGAPFIALTFDPRESDLVLRTAWPVLVSHLVRQLTAAGAEAPQGALQLGRIQHRALSEPQTRAASAVHPKQVGSNAELRVPSGRTKVLDIRDRQVQLTPEEPGFYELSAGGTQQLMAANLASDVVASIGPRRLAPDPATEPKRDRVWPGSEALWSWLLAAALLVLAFDAWRQLRGESR